MKLKKIAAAIALSLGAVSAANAYLFDPDGTGGAPAVNINSFDWSQSTFAAINGTAAIAAFQATGGACPGTVCNFDVYTHATLGVLRDTNNNPVNLPAGTEITMVAHFTERVTAVTANQATFQTSGGTGNLEIYFDSTPDQNALSGGNFNDGRLILVGTVVPAGTEGIFRVNGGPVLLDQVGLDNYAGQQTVTGFGGNDNINVGGLTYDSSFFVTPLASLGLIFQDISLGLPFATVDPSHCVTTHFLAPGAVGTTVAARDCDALTANAQFSGQTAGLIPPGTVPNIGPVNGLFGSGGTDFIAQTDYNSSFRALVPEPASLSLMGLGLGLAGWFGRRRSRK